jgi:hypothetical protein
MTKQNKLGVLPPLPRTLGDFFVELRASGFFDIATAKVIRTFLIVETLDFLSLEPSAFCPVPSAFCYNFFAGSTAPVPIHRHEVLMLQRELLQGAG